MSWKERLRSWAGKRSGLACPTGFVDLHTHVLPAVDDGAPSLRHTVEMLRVAHLGGTRRIVATPHMYHPAFEPRSVAEIEQRFAETVGQLADLASQRPKLAFLREMELLLGAENHVSTEFLDALETGSPLSLGGGRYTLVELPDDLPPHLVDNTLDRVLATGRIPLVAHIERYTPFRADQARLGDLVESGCMLQVNGSSVVGRFGGGLRQAARAMLRGGWIHVVASDGHNVGLRSTSLAEVFEILTRWHSRDQVLDWMVDLPASLLP